MRRLCCSKILFLIFGILLFLRADPIVGFYYGNEPTDTMISGYDWFVVDPAQIDSIWVFRYPQKLFAYVSVGEIEKWRHPNETIPDSWRLGENSAWGGMIADLSSKDYRAFLMKKMHRLYKKGYRNFFLDTLDAPFGVLKKRERIAQQKEALRSLIRQIRAAFPKAKIITNRGVEVMQTLCKNIDGFAIESLYRGIDTKTMKYRSVPEADRNWIRAQLDRAKACGLVPIVIDYVDPSDTKLREETAKKIEAEGYLPFVTDMHLKYPGTGVQSPMKREVLLLYDSRNLKDGDKVYASVHLMASMPLEYMGYIPVLKDIDKGLPDAGVERYAGVIVWPDRNMDDLHFFEWVRHWMEKGQKFLFINGFGFEMTPQRAEFFGLEYKESHGTEGKGVKIVRHDKIVGYELPPAAGSLPWLPKVKEGKVLIEAENDKKERFDAAAIMPWGGYAIAESAQRDLANEPYWLIDPFAFFKGALHLKNFPVPDPTTENGRRLFFIHIDGDGFIEKARFSPRKYAADILYEKILKKYRLPHSVSVIEGEIGEKGLYPGLAAKMEKKAKRIFALPFVEPASHTYSHPFKWQKLSERDLSGKRDEAHYHLPIPGYRFDLKREVEGSVSFIERKLLPKGRRCTLFFWSGDCLPREDALRMCERDGLGAINGGDTTITEMQPWLGRIAPFGLQRGDFWQIYVGEQNENIYTNDWRGPFWGYRRVIETFKLTESPRRLKPINIYYHFYSASRRPSLEALQSVYRWVLKQKIFPIFTSEYIDIVHDFYRTAIIKTKSGFRIRNSGTLRTLRIEKSVGYPDLANSRGIVGFKDEKGARYLHLDGSGDYLFRLRSTPPERPYLIEANGEVVRMQKEAKEIRFVLHSHLPLQMRFYKPKGCRIHLLQRGFRIRHRGNEVVITAQKAKEAEVRFVCR
ncbi:MAG: hypothetical protein B6D59_00730 [Campylobacteraceae bacterium 4484_4]|nr:MAG: hypothetical protein B6D59_00730 [Campylobacteraceae bacterium 4484_4]